MHITNTSYIYWEMPVCLKTMCSEIEKEVNSKHKVAHIIISKEKLLRKKEMSDMVYKCHNCNSINSSSFESELCRIGLIKLSAERVMHLNTKNCYCWQCPECNRRYYSRIEKAVRVVLTYEDKN